MHHVYSQRTSRLQFFNSITKYNYVSIINKRNKTQCWQKKTRYNGCDIKNKEEIKGVL
jgi:hypothetical protein